LTLTAGRIPETSPQWPCAPGQQIELTKN